MFLGKERSHFSLVVENRREIPIIKADSQKNKNVERGMYENWDTRKCLSKSQLCLDSLWRVPLDTAGLHIDQLENNFFN